jgi:thiol:disulfide interchange protein DsbD
MKFIHLLLLFTLSVFSSPGRTESRGPFTEAALAPQPKDYVTWTFSQKKISADEFELIFTAKIESGWHLYSQIESPDGPLATIFEFEPSKSYKRIGKVIEPKPHDAAEPMFGPDVVVHYFENTAVFKQKIKALTADPFVVKGYVDGMACNESQCQKFSPAPEFSFKISGAVLSGATNSSDTSVAEAVTLHDTSAKVESQMPSEQPKTEGSNMQFEPAHSQNESNYWG